MHRDHNRIIPVQPGCFCTELYLDVILPSAGLLCGSSKFKDILWRRFMLFFSRPELHLCETGLDCALALTPALALEGKAGICLSKHGLLWTASPRILSSLWGFCYVLVCCPDRSYICSQMAALIVGIIFGSLKLPVYWDLFFLLSLALLNLHSANALFSLKDIDMHTKVDSLEQCMIPVVDSFSLFKERHLLSWQWCVLRRSWGILTHLFQPACFILLRNSSPKKESSVISSTVCSYL